MRTLNRDLERQRLQPSPPPDVLPRPRLLPRRSPRNPAHLRRRQKNVLNLPVNRWKGGYSVRMVVIVGRFIVEDWGGLLESSILRFLIPWG
jgi:hypothetical protein